MLVLIDRLKIVRVFANEVRRHGMPDVAGASDREVVFVLDGVGGFQFVPAVLRHVWRGVPDAPGTILFKWQFRPPGRMLLDLMCRRRNERKAAELAERMISFRARHPNAIIHVIAYSGGTGVAVWACERLRGKVGLTTLVLACSALSRTYNLAGALAAVERCYALVSEKDRVLLGLGTGLFGTIDRRRAPAAGRVGFEVPVNATVAERNMYRKLGIIRWTPELRSLDHRGGHTGWASARFMREHLLPMLRGRPLLPTATVQ